MTPFVFPVSAVPDPRLAPGLRWGILGTGWIAARFAEALQKHTDQVVAAVGSRTAGRAERFAREHGIEAVFSPYEALCSAPGLDAIYVASPQHEHRDHALLAIEAGKAVLVEKPFTTTAAEARDIAGAARDRGVFAMEAMWTRYLPHNDVVRQMLRDGALGEVRLVSADHGQLMPPDSRLYRPDAGGGALLDLGIYPFAFAWDVLGAPLEVRAHGSLAESGVDAQSTIAPQYDQAHANLSTSLLTKSPNRAAIAGTGGLLEFGSPFFVPAELHYSSPVLGSRTVQRPADDGIPMHEGLCYQAAAMARYIVDGQLESPLQPLDESVRIMAAIDDARHQIGYRLPGE